MNSEVTVTYTKQIIETSVRMQWYKLIGPSGLVLLPFLAVAAAYLFISGDRTWIFGVSLSLFVIYSGVLIFGYFRLRNLSVSKFRKMASPIATFRFTDFGISIEADTGKVELAWKMVEDILKSRDVWILLTEAGGITLPTQLLDDKMKQDILKFAKGGELKND